MSDSSAFHSYVPMDAGDPFALNDKLKEKLIKNEIIKGTFHLADGMKMKSINGYEFTFSNGSKKCV